MTYKIIQRTKKRLSGGNALHLGASLTERGVNFAIYSKYARRIYLLLFDRLHADATDVIAMNKNPEEGFWSIFVEGISSGQLYGYKVEGDYDPAEGMRFNPCKLLIDPYAKAIAGQCHNKNNILLGYDHGSLYKDKDLIMDKRDNTRFVAKSVVIEDDFDWGGDSKPDIPFEKLILYEVHVKGFTAHGSSRVKSPGTYLGFIEKIPYLKDLGINAVELLPVHQFYKRDELIANGLTEYWGYNTIGFFAPEASFSSRKHYDSPVREFKTLIRELHKAGIQVILDVVYNHTGEGDHLGPTLCFRGIDNSSYYALRGEGDNPYRYYTNITGCGNLLNMESPIAMRLALDSLRYWVEFMHVDGFRFDLASALARANGFYSKESAFLKAVSQDPVLKGVKIIAEPWDLSTYQVGNFPSGWSEWNGRFRDTARKFIKGEPGQARELSHRITGSPDIYDDGKRYPYNSINFITCHDGFTLNDLYSYNVKHNQSNRENNRDGTDYNNSFNCGHEGPTRDKEINALRRLIIKNAFCCLLIPAGIPMILGGDEFLRTQRGNNNAYCQDNEISWFNWQLVKKNQDMVEFVKKLIAFRKRYSVLQRRRFFTGQDMDNDQVPDIQWFGVDGGKVDWDDPNLKTFCCQLDGSEEPSVFGDYHLFFIMNSDIRGHRIILPRYYDMRWYRVIDTALPSGDDFCENGREVLLKSQGIYKVAASSVVALLGQK